MNVLDLFSGACGGWSLGLHRAGFRTVAAVEIDPWRRQQFAANFPDAKLYNDVRAVTAEQLRADAIGPIDLVCGSPPCQDASAANTKGKGIDGERTGLYLEAVRIVREIRPRWCAFENVPGIRNRGIDRVLGELEQADYAAWPLVVGALDLGAPHIRKRSWIVCADAATLHRLAQSWDQSNGDYELAVADASEGNVREQSGRWSGPCWAAPSELVGGGAQSIAADHMRANYNGRHGDEQDRGRSGWPQNVEGVATDQSSDGRRQGRTGRPPSSNPGQQAELVARPLERAIAERVGAIAEDWNGGIAGRIGMDDGLPKGMARPMLAAYGDAVIPQVPEIIGRAIMAAERVTG